MSDSAGAWDESRHAVEALEERVGVALLDNPPHLVDQWGAEIRDLFGKLESDLVSAGHARSAFTGAYIVAALLTQSGPVNVGAIRQVCTLMRWLHERGDQEDGAWSTLTTTL